MSLHKERLQSLARRFTLQAEFAQETAPLSARLCAIIAQWLAAYAKKKEADAYHFVAHWLLISTSQRSSFSVPMLVMAGLHREILKYREQPTGRIPRAIFDLATFYPTFYPSGQAKMPPHHPKLETILCRAIVSCQKRLTPFLATANVQTNETARGLAWLLPVQALPWQDIHLLDIGASAGLNLLAEQRRYTLYPEGAQDRDSEGRLILGKGQEEQFTIPYAGEVRLSGAEFSQKRSKKEPVPQILSRTGWDSAPFSLDTATARITLAAFIWPDHPQRLQRLEEGFTAFDMSQKSSAPVQMESVEFPIKMEEHLTALPDDAPIVVYNTYLFTYLKDQGKTLHTCLKDWAKKRQHPVLHVQWEPVWKKKKKPYTPKGIPRGWLAWTVTLWHQDQVDSKQIAWVHPHGQTIHWRAELKDWLQAASTK